MLTVMAVGKRVGNIVGVRSSVRRLLVACIGGVIVTSLAACGGQEFVRAPTPEYVQAVVAEPTLAGSESAGGFAESAEDYGPEDVEADAVEGGDGDVDLMVPRDDAGRPLSNDAAWTAFDAALGSQLVPANSAASVAVMVNGEVVHQAAFGARLPGGAEETGVGDRFRIASISKTITSIVVLQLVDDGVLSLDQEVGRAVADYLGMGDISGAASSITVRELLSHTSGFAEFHSIFFRNQVGSCRDAAIYGLNHVGGGGFDYSNMNYCVLGLLIESVTGKAYERVVQEKLLDPLGIAGMRWTTTFEIAPDEVSHYPTPGRNYMEALGAAGQWNATPTDLVRIINAVDPKTPGWKALSPSGMSAIRYRVPHGGAPSGYGLGIINYSGGAWGHTGTIEHAHSMVLVQDNGVTWAVSVSGETPSRTGQLRSIVGRAMSAAFSSPIDTSPRA